MRVDTPASAEDTDREDDVTTTDDPESDAEDRSAGDTPTEQQGDGGDDQSAPDQSAGGASPRRGLLVAAMLTLCLIVAVTGSLAWRQSAKDPDIARAKTRDAVLIQAKQAIATLNTLDYRKVSQGLAAWAAVTTGTLHDQLTQVDAQDKKLLAEQGKISTGKVVDAGVAELDGSSATVVASVEVSVRDGSKPSADPTVKRNRFSAELVKVGTRWKLESLTQVPVDIS